MIPRRREPEPGQPLGLRDYVRSAFREPYNLILFFGGLAAGVISGLAPVVVPLVAAVELSYLVSISHNGRYRNLVNARRQWAARKAPSNVAANQAASRLLDSLSRERRKRFEEVRARCLDLQHAFRTVAGDAAADDVLNQQQTEGVNKLLWVFARTLATEQALDVFCAKTPGAEIRATLAETERALAAGGLSDVMKKAYEDNVQVLRQRLENLRRAEEQQENLQARLVRVENSIMLIQEQALTRRDPSFIESEVSAVTEGLASTADLFDSISLPDVEGLTEGPAPEMLSTPPPVPLSQ